ncbi:MAG: alpha/beta hydrolase [Erysipelotrichaceae bacterium]|nr:alpha/beta hydrolase [Erysipelotrichaceae bacterium]
MFNASEKTVEVGGSTMTYLVFGRGERPLVIIPGLSLQSVHGYALPMAWTYRIYSRDYRVYVFDKKEDLRKECTIRDLADDLFEAMKKLDIERADVIGISQGGMIAQYLAIDHPEAVNRLVLGVTLSRPNDTIVPLVNSWIREASEGRYDVIVKDMLTRMYSDTYVRRYRLLIPLLMKMVRLNDPERFITLARTCLSCNTYDELERIKCPVLVLGGSEDRIVSGEASLEIVQKLGCPVHMYEGLGHAAYEEAKDFDRRILAFFKSEGDML